MTTTFKIENGDLVRDPFNNGYQKISGRDKTKQDIQMVLSTSTRKLTGLGCGLDELIGEDSENPAAPFAPSPIMFEFQTRVQGGLNILRAAQRSYLFSQRTLDELIDKIYPVEMWASAEDPRNFRWKISISTIEGKAGIIVKGTG